jgi:hypothetical protein
VEEMPLQKLGYVGFIYSFWVLNLICLVCWHSCITIAVESVINEHCCSIYSGNFVLQAVTRFYHLVHPPMQHPPIPPSLHLSNVRKPYNFSDIL